MVKKKNSGVIRKINHQDDIYKKDLSGEFDDDIDAYSKEYNKRKDNERKIITNIDDDWDYQDRTYNNRNKTQYSNRGGYYHDDYYSDGYYGGGYGGGYYGNNNYRYNGSGYSGFNWGSYSSRFDEVSTDKEDDFIKSFESYITPSESKLRDRLGYGVDPGVIDIVRNLSKYFFARSIDDKNYISEFWSDDSKLNDDQKAYKKTWSDIYDKYWDIAVPGSLPTDKALYVIKEIMGNTDKKKMDPHLIEEWLEKNEIKIDDEIYADPILNELIDLANFKGEKMDILSKISLIKNFGTTFKVEKEITPIEVYNNTDKINRNIKTLEEIHKALPYELAHPSFKFKLARKNVRISQPIKKDEKKQVIIMLVDFSGSMCEKEKQEWVFAILIDRLKYCVLEECEIYFSYFLTVDNYPGNRRGDTRFSFFHIYNKETAIEFLTKRVSQQPNGGDTQLGLIVDLIAQDIQQGKLGNLTIDFKENEHYKPELLAIADGQDTVKTKNFSYKTNAVSILGYNKELKDMCLNHEGAYIDINNKVMNIHQKNGVLVQHLDKYKQV